MMNTQYLVELVFGISIFEMITACNSFIVCSFMNEWFINFSNQFPITLKTFQEKQREKQLNKNITHCPLNFFFFLLLFSICSCIVVVDFCLYLFGIHSLYEMLLLIWAQNAMCIVHVHTAYPNEYMYLYLLFAFILSNC